MNTDGTTDFLSFRCPDCGKRLKVARRHAGRRVPCPRCGERIVIPTESDTGSDDGPRTDRVPADTREKGEPAADGSALHHVEPVRTLAPEIEQDLLRLGAPAISDVDRRVEESQAAKAARAKKLQEAQQKRSVPKSPVGNVEPIAPLVVPRRPVADDDAPLPLDDEDDPSPPSPSSTASRGDRRVSPAGQESDRSSGRSSPGGRTPSGSAAAVPRSAFDDDLPELEALEEVVRHSASEDEILATHLGADPAGGAAGDEFSSELDDELPSLLDTGARTRKSDGVQEYRVVCPTCGTGQYVAFSAVGMKIKCPDCFSEFKVPPPPKHLLAKKQKKTPPPEQLDDVPRIREEEPEQDTSDRLKKGRTKEILSRAAQELTEEQQDELYRMEFDTAGFMRRTFGFLTDIVVVSQIIGYGLVFALLFGLVHYSLLDTQSFFGRGLLLISFILAPLATLLFALPMFSGGLLLIESVANKQPRLEALPSFNMFDNFAELMVLSVSLATSAAPGFILGGLLGGEAAIYARLIGSMLSSVLLFPIILLSMLEGGSLMSVVTSNVLQSLAKAPQAWGAYYLKIFSGYVVMGLLWMMLIGRNPAATALIGATVPLLFFFTCQQLGLLADDISDELSIEISSPKDQDQEDAEEEGGGGTAGKDLDDLEA
ncbi:MAG: hypothetical protein D6753_11695 [Planctomycetota bacterium]|nr:MAG: hypothetical protein D6753_11695 [Planctomycetota bacterium]